MVFKVNNGTLYGLIVAVAPLYLSLFVPIFLMLSCVVMQIRKSLCGHRAILVIFISIKLIWMAIIQITIGQLTLFENIRIFFPDILLIIFAFLKPSKKFIQSYFEVLYLLFLCDFLFNLSIVLFGSDLLGRVGALRPGDFFQRVGGIFGHPFTSVQITVVAVICATALNKRGLLILALLGLFINGTLKAPLALVLLIVIIVAIPIFSQCIVFGMRIDCFRRASFCRNNYDHFRC